MFVIKRDGRSESVKFDKITSRLDKLCYGLHDADPVLVTQKVIQGVYPGVTTAQLDELAAETAAFLSSTSPDYSILAARIAVSNLHKNTSNIFSEAMEQMFTNPGRETPLISQSTWDVVQAHTRELNDMIRHERDYEYDYFAFKTLERSYLCRVNDVIVERPQYMLLRVAIGIHGWNIARVRETYD